jgi:hypothetical protein
MTNQDVYTLLDKLNRPWGRKDATHIYVWTSGYKTCHDDGHYGIEAAILPAGFRMIEETFCKENGQTKAVYRHGKE